MRAEKLKLGEFKNHFTDKILEENERLKAQVHQEYETKLSN